MGLILPGLSSAYVGERGKAHSRAGAQAGSASRESKLHILHRLYCPRWCTPSWFPSSLQLPSEKPQKVQMEMEVCEMSIRYSMFWVGKQVTRRSLLVTILKWTAESNPWHLFNSYPCKQWIHIPLSKLKLRCGASLSRVNITLEKGEKKKWISPFPFVYGGSLFSLYTDLGWGLGRVFFSPLRKMPHQGTAFFKKVACTETLIWCTL